MAKKSAEPFVAGWLFWGIVAVILSGPSIYFFWRVVDQEESRALPVAIGLIMAALGAGIVAWAVNAVLQYAQRKTRLAERKKAKKR